jgi:aminoglycoside 6'-N-acetyltransferase
MGDVTLAVGLAGDRVVLRPVVLDDYPVLLHISSAPEVRQWRNDGGLQGGWPLSTRPSTTRFTVLTGRRIAGMIQFWENVEPRDRHASMEIFLDPDLHGRGLGRDAIRTLARHLFHDREHHRLVIDPDASNEIAIRCCAAVGFRPVGTVRANERRISSLRDGLVMDLLSSELR